MPSGQGGALSSSAQPARGSPRSTRPATPGPGSHRSRRPRRPMPTGARSTSSARGQGAAWRRSSPGSATGRAGRTAATSVRLRLRGCFLPGRAHGSGSRPRRCTSAAPSLHGPAGASSSPGASTARGAAPADPLRGLRGGLVSPMVARAWAGGRYRLAGCVDGQGVRHGGTGRWRIRSAVARGLGPCSGDLDPASRPAGSARCQRRERSGDLDRDRAPRLGLAQLRFRRPAASLSPPRAGTRPVAVPVREAAAAQPAPPSAWRSSRPSKRSSARQLQRSEKNARGPAPYELVRKPLAPGWPSLL
jgi:hypothetical protein